MLMKASLLICVVFLGCGASQQGVSVVTEPTKTAYTTHVPECQRVINPVGGQGYVWYILEDMGNAKPRNLKVEVPSKNNPQLVYVVTIVEHCDR